MKVVFVASEAAPIAKVGGLADVVGSLPKALTKLGIDVKIVIPKYGVISPEQFPQQFTFSDLEVFFNHKLEKFKVFKTLLPATNIEVFLIEHPILSSNGVYLSTDATPEGVTDVSRFAFFSEAATLLLDEKFGEFDIIHCHDWHTAIIPDLIKVKFKPPHILAKVAQVLTIHNLGVAYQGAADPAILHLLDLKPESLPQIEADIASGDINFLQQGIETADVLNTVSPQYAAEIQTQEFGGQLAKILRKRETILYGILNGIDYEFFNPETDKNLVINYNNKSWSRGKAANKKALEEKLGFAHDGKIMAGMVTRLDEQKGLDLVLQALSEFKSMGIKLAILGRGDPSIESKFGAFCQSNPQDVSCTFKFDPSLANQIYAGSDIFIMPSKFEPCGLGQMISARYGTISVVRDVGGLHDTVEDGVTGFKFKEFNSSSLIGGVKRALESFSNRQVWSKMVEAAIAKDFSWDRSAVEYVKLYEKALEVHNLLNI